MQALKFLSLFAPIVFSNSVNALDNITFGNFAHSATFSVARELGFFAHFNLNVIYEQIPNSTFAFEQLASGAYDVLSAQIDNAVTLRLNSNESLTVLGQLDAGPELVLASILSITSVSDLRGKTIIVDSPTSGYAFVLQKILSYFGLRLDQGDYSFQAVGGTSIRFNDLTAGIQPNGSTVFGTILNYPFVSEIIGLPSIQQPNILAQLSDFILPYASSALTISQSSLSSPTKRSKLVRLYAALLAANKYLAIPAHANSSIAAITKVLNVSAAIGKSAYEAAIDSLTGETSAVGGNFTVDRIGLLNVIDVRDQFGGFSGLHDADPGFSFVDFIEPGDGGFIDYSVQRDAIAAQDSWIPGDSW